MRFDSPSWVTRIGAFAGLAFMHIPVLVIILYAFTTEDRTYQFPPPGLTLRWFDAAFARSDIWHSLTLGDYIIPQIIGTSRLFIGQAVYTQQGTAGNIPLAAALTVVPIVIMGLYLLAARRLGAFNAL